MSGPVPRPGQPCVNRVTGDLFVVARLDLEGHELVIGVRPHGAGRRARVTSMRLADWRRLFAWPEPPG